jgi:N-methylhydantoinase B/oxoprolinase/acetone carboxylase alpha subunit
MDQQDEKVLAPKVSGVPLKAGDTLTMLTSGGGGFGPPGQRDPDAVLRDVEDGIVSIESARRDYGVVIDQATLAIDHDETKRIRATLASGS